VEHRVPMASEEKAFSKLREQWHRSKNRSEAKGSRKAECGPEH